MSHLPPGLAQWFFNDMKNSCTKLPFQMIGACVAWAGIYYSAVRALGQRYYDSGGQLSRISTPMRA
jgi:hypothetical protein